MSFLNLRIRGRLYGGFGALVLFGIATAVFAVWQLSAINAQVAALTLQSNNTIRVEEIATELQAIRRAVLRYASITTRRPSQKLNRGWGRQPGFLKLLARLRCPKNGVLPSRRWSGMWKV